MRACRRDVLLVLDAAYAEYVRRNDYEAGLELVATAENVVMTRTFSKIYGLASLRLGWMVGAGRMSSTRVNRIRGPFNVNGPAHGGRHRGDRRTSAHVAQRRRAQRDVARLADAARSRRSASTVTPSVGNFLLIHFPERGRQDRAGRRCVPAAPRPDPAPGRRLRPAAMPAPDGRQRGGEPARGRALCAIFCRRPACLSVSGRLRETPLFERLALVGIGLIGSSIARAARHRKLAGTIVAIDRERGDARAGARARHRRRGRRAMPAAGVRGADLVILCVPVGACGAVAERDRGRALKPGAIVTDVGSVKGSVIAQVAAASAGGRAFRPGASGGRHRVFGARCGLCRRSSSTAGASSRRREGTDEAAVERCARSGRRSARMSRS